MATRRHIKAILISVLLPLTSCPLKAQGTPEQIQQALIGQPLYLRGFWIGDKLEFDGAGHLRNASEQGPLTLSGVDVREVTLRGKDLIIRGQRAALVADSDGRLERRTIFSTTHLEFSFRRNPDNKYIAYRELTLLVHPDSSGGFDKALKAIFANGLDELASSVPPYWACYAQGYFAPTVGIVEARKTVATCIEASTLSRADPQRGNPSGFTPAKITSTVPPHFTIVAAELGVRGVSHVRFTVSQHGIPVGLQIMRAVGGGLDEETLRTISKYHFEPARRNGSPVPADLDVNLEFSLNP